MSVRCDDCAKDNIKFETTCKEVSKSNGGYALVNSCYPAFNIEDYSKTLAPQCETADAILQEIGTSELIIVEFKGDNDYLLSPYGGYDSQTNSYKYFDSNLQVGFSQNETLLAGNLCTCKYNYNGKKLLIFNPQKHKLRARFQNLKRECLRYGVQIMNAQEFDSKYKNL